MTHEIDLIVNRTEEQGAALHDPSFRLVSPPPIPVSLPSTFAHGEQLLLIGKVRRARDRTSEQRRIRLRVHQLIVNGLQVKKLGRLGHNNANVRYTMQLWTRSDVRSMPCSRLGPKSSI